MEASSAIILFDGVCTLCSRSAQFVIRRDPAGHFRFCALQSDRGRAMLLEHGRSPEDLDSIVLIDDHQVWQRSDAVLRICGSLPPPWSWLKSLRIIPRRVRDPLYNLLAQNRYRWFGRQDSCRIPSDLPADRFLT